MGIEAGYDGRVVIAVATVVMMLVVLPLEKRYPIRAAWNRNDGQILNDIGHSLAGCQLGAWAGAGLIGVAASGVAADLSVWLGHALWPARWPLALQVMLALMVGELGGYWQHRLSHHIPLVWRFHSLHHSTDRMMLLKSGRFHFLDFMTYTAMIHLPAVLAGAPAQVFLWLGATINFIGIVQHANVRMTTPGWLNRVIATPAVHMLHHARDVRAGGDANFGTNVMIFDLLFGTFMAPTEPIPPPVGIENDPVPRGLWAQLLAPLGLMRVPGPAIAVPPRGD